MVNNLFIIEGSALSWQEYISDMAQQNNWLQTMRHAMMIFENKMVYFSEIPCNVDVERKEAMQDYFQKLALSYVMVNIKSDKIVSID